MPVQFNLERDPTLGLLPPGIYKFVVEDATEKTSKAGPYVNLRLRPYSKGQKWGSSVFEGLYQTKESRWKVEQFFNSVGAPLSGNVGAVEWFKGKSGWAKFDHRVNNRSGLPEATVAAFLTEEEAERAIATLAEKAGQAGQAFDDGEPVVAQRPARTAAKSPSKASSAAVKELDEDTPF